MKNNIIDFNKHHPDASKRRLIMRLDADQVKVVITTSLISILFVVSLANESLLSGHSGELTASSVRQERMLASVNMKDKDWENQMIQRLSDSSQAEIQAMGRGPTPLETLMWGDLEGRYNARLANGQLEELQLSGAQPAEMSLKDRVAFIEQHRAILPVEFRDLRRIDSSRNAEGRTETIELIGRDKKPVAKVSIQLDQRERLVSMKVSSLTEAK